MTIEELNTLDSDGVRTELTKCCGAHKWVDQMATLRPFENIGTLLEASTKIWFNCKQTDWLEAFTHHPKIGDVKSLEEKFTNTKDWAGNEQKSVETASVEAIEKLAHLNTVYEDKFGFIFIVCATGKSAEEMLEILMSRLDNNYTSELKIAMGEQHKITKLRLEKLLL